MKVLICEEARPLLEEYHDDELAVSDQIAVRSHLDWCDECADFYSDLRLMRSMVRAATPTPVFLDREEGEAFHAAVVGRAGAEAEVSWSARFREALEDRQLFYATLGAAAATVFCVAVLTSMMRFAAPDRPGSLAAIFSLLARPKVTVEDINAPGTDRNPVAVDGRMAMPRAVDQIFVSSTSGSADMVYTLSAVVTREGRVKNLELHSPMRTPKAGSQEAEAVDTLLSVASVARFEPAKVAGLPVAVNMVWVVANTTVRASKRALALPPDVVPSPRKRQAELETHASRTTV